MQTEENILDKIHTDLINATEHARNCNFSVAKAECYIHLNRVKLAIELQYYTIRYLCHKRFNRKCMRIRAARQIYKLKVRKLK